MKLSAKNYVKLRKKGKITKKLLKHKPYKSNFELSSKRILQRIQIQAEGDWSQKDWDRWGGGEQKCKITNMSHNRIHVYNIVFCYNLHFQGKGS